jgi:hypothetical protein
MPDVSKNCILKQPVSGCHPETVSGAENCTEISVDVPGSVKCAGVVGFKPEITA